MIIVASGDAVLYKTSTLHNFYNAPRRRKIPDGDQLMADNFLPDCHPAVTHGTKNTLRCLIRDTAFHATPEELVRQRVLHWLIHTKGWKKNDLRLEKSYKLVGDPARKRIRADLELLNDGKVVVVVECKRGDVPLGEHVDRQAIEYAIKGRAKWIWTTNGESHRFLQKSGSDWPPVESLEPLGVLSAPPVAELKVPTNANDRRAVERYWKAFGDQQVREDRGSYDCNFVLAVHRVLFDKDMRQKLPYSHGGVHILEDRGSDWHQFRNAGGRHHHTRYADFNAATQGRVEAVSVGVNPSRNGRKLWLCVGVTKPKMAHHALQLDIDKCERDERTRSWRIYHDGSMSRIERATVLEAVREAQAGQWIQKDKRIYLGRIHDNATWRNSRKFLARLIHYGIIRSNLREAHKKRSRRESNSNA